MNDRSWDELLDLVDTKYEIDKHSKREEPLVDNPTLKKQITMVLFEKNNEKYKIERVTSPAVTDTKTHYAHRGGAQRMQKLYDPTETVNHVFFYIQRDGAWHEVAPEGLFTS